MSSEKELLSAFLSATLNMDEAGVASLYKDGGTELLPEALDILKAKDVERVKKLKPNTQEFIDNGYKKAQSEIMSKLEKEFKEKTGFSSEKKGIDLFVEYAESKIQSTDVTEDAVKRHPIFISSIEKLTKEKEEAVTAKQKEFEDFQNGIKKRETFSSVANKATEIFNALKPVLSQDPGRAKNQMELFVDKLKDFDYEIQDERIVVLNKDGSVFEDSHGNRIQFEKLIKDTASKYYDFHVAEKRTTPNNGAEVGKTAANTLNIQVPKNEAEYAAIIADSSIPLKDREAVKEAYASKQN